MSQIKYVHVLEYEDGNRVIGPGKGDKSGTHVSVEGDGDWERYDFERVDYWELPEPMPKSEFQDWFVDNKGDDVEPIPSVLEVVAQQGGDER